MNYLNINVNSLAFSKLSKEEKFKVVKIKLNALFNSDSKKNITVIHDGVKKTIPYEKSGEYKDLCEREKKFKKYNFDYDFDDSSSNDGRVLKDSTRHFLVSSTDSLSKEDDSTTKAMNGTSGFVAPRYDQFIYEDLFPVFESKKEKNSDVSKKIEISNEKKVSGVETTIENDLKIPNISELVEEKKDIILGIKDEKNFNSLNKDETSTQEKVFEVFGKEENNELCDDEDYTDIWKDAFRKRDLALGYEEKSYGVNITKIKHHDYKKSDDDSDLSSIWSPVFNKKMVNNAEKNDIYQAEIIDNTEEKVESKKKNKKGFIAGILAIPFIKKLRDRKKVILNPIEDRTNKKRNLKISALALALAATTIICSMIPGMSKKKSHGIGKAKPSETIVFDEPSAEEPVEDIIIDEPSTEETTVDDIIVDIHSTEDENNYIENDYGFTFDDKVTIEDNAYIYYSSYDATYENNNLTPLFDGSYERDIMGIVYNVDGNIYTIYSSDPDAYNKAQELMDKGASQEAVLVTRSDLVYTGQYEGYYNKDDVKILTKRIG